MGSTGRPESKTGTVFFSRTYDEALSLVFEAREYLLGPGRLAVKDLSNEGSFCYATESLRLTTRLTESMAWLMYQRAILEGEITAEQGRDENCYLQQQETCLPETPSEHFPLLPAGLQSLLERSEALYRRIDRLDQQFRASLEAEEGPKGPDTPDNPD
ncbi:DUF1465 family protein [Sneathiella chinensis]|nr:DUF1465 family protein [Sneathiella chinensis]